MPRWGRKSPPWRKRGVQSCFCPLLKIELTDLAAKRNLALIQVTFGENSRAISTLTHLLQTPYISWLYDRPVTPSLLRLDPIWDPLRADPAFQKLCGEKQP